MEVSIHESRKHGTAAAVDDLCSAGHIPIRRKPLSDAQHPAPGDRDFLRRGPKRIAGHHSIDENCVSPQLHPLLNVTSGPSLTRAGLLDSAREHRSTVHKSTTAQCRVLLNYDLTWHKIHSRGNCLRGVSGS